MLYLFFACLIVYSVVLLWLAIGYLRSPFFKSSQKRLQLGISIIICARNEEQTIWRCLDSILKQDYVLQRIQLILINDASSDHTVKIAESILRDSGIHYKIISNQQRKGKKASITYALQFADHSLIVLRDADTFTTSVKWLQNIADIYQEKKADLIIGPVAVANNVGLLWAIQAVENNILSLLACGSSYYKKPFLCSGANLIFTKQIFEKTNGFAPHQHIESGDDVLFMEDVKKIPGSSIIYLKSSEAVVYTYPAYSFGKLINQKTRWASKFKVNSNFLNRWLAVVTFVTNLGWIFCFASGFMLPQKNHTAVLFISLKLVFDFLLLFLTMRFIKNRQLSWYAVPVGCVYPIYASIVALNSIFKKPKWSRNS